MDKLSQIIRTFDNYKLRHIDVLNNQDSKSRATELYQQIQKGKINTDDEAAKFLFGPEANKSTGKYRVFKADFKKRVMNTLLFIDTSNPTLDEYQQATYDIHREWMEIKALLKGGMSHIAAPLAEQLLVTALKYEYAEITVPLISAIKYGIAMKGEKELYHKYQDLHTHYMGMWLAEQKAEEYNNLLRMEYVKTAEYKSFVADTAKGYFEELKPLMEKYSSAVLHMWARSVELYMYSTISDYKGILAVAERALIFFSAKSFVIKTPISIFLQQKMIALMMLKRYPEAYEAIDETIKLRVRGSFNWFKGQESKVALLFRMHRYTEGYAIYRDITAMPEFEKILTGMNREIWSVFNAYFHLMHKLGSASDLALEEKEFKLQKFLNDVPTFNNDKKGMYLAILIIEICYMMSARQQNTLIDRIEAIQKYLTRNTLKTDPSYRFNQFANMLLEIPKSGFMRSVLEKNTAVFFKDLQSVPYDMVESIYRSEVVALEELWGLVLNNYEKLK